METFTDFLAAQDREKGSTELAREAWDAAKTSQCHRKYSIDEIDAMRRAIHYIRTGRVLPIGREPGAELTEMELRTHMLNGTEPADLIAKEREAHAFAEAELENYRREKSLTK